MYSFLLVNYNMKGLIEQCIDSLAANLTCQNNYEIIVADNSTDDNFRIEQQFVHKHTNLTVIHIQKNEGWVAALNSILPKAGGDFIIIMHPDVVLCPGTLNALESFLINNDRAAIVAPNLYYPDGKENSIRVKFPSAWIECKRIINIVTHILLKRTFLTDELLWDHDKDITVDAVMSVCMMIRSDVLHKIGQIEPRLWTYYGNDYLCAKVNEMGMTCHYLSGVKAIHHERYSSKELYSSEAASDYKSTAMPVSARMEKDRLIFLETLYSPFHVLIFRFLSLIEYSIHLVAQLKAPAGQRVTNIRHILDTIRVILK